MKTNTPPSVVLTSSAAVVSGFILGLDLDDRVHHVCVLDAAGQIVREVSLPNTRPALAQLLTEFPHATVALEAGTHTHEAKTVTCQAGLCDIAVPVRMGDQLIGFLTTGQVFRKKPTEAQFNRTLRLLAEWGVKLDEKELRQAYFDTRVISNKQHESVVKLLAIFAEHLSMVSNQIVVREQNAELPVITRAKQFITDHQTEELSLEQVAKSVNTSKFYFCKIFKKATGINFTDYLSRVRTERAKNLLLNPNLRVSEIAYEVGFQSLTHFNRVFKRILGRSPTDYRDQLSRA